LNADKGTRLAQCVAVRAHLRLGLALAGKGIDTENNAKADIPASAARYDDPGLLEISLSPAMTFKGIDPGCGIEVVQGEAQ
jgi:hypothetical protein